MYDFQCFFPNFKFFHFVPKILLFPQYPCSHMFFQSLNIATIFLIHQFFPHTQILSSAPIFFPETSNFFQFSYPLHVFLCLKKKKFHYQIPLKICLSPKCHSFTKSFAIICISFFIDSSKTRIFHSFNIIFNFPNYPNCN